MSKLIKINLAPPEELENPLWFIPDVAAFIVVAMISYFIVDSSLEKIRDEIELANIQAQELSDQNVRLKSQIKRFDELNNIKENLTRKRDAVEKITSSSLDRYLPIIILEHIQNLKPEGIWLKNISFMKTEENNELAAVNTQSAGATNNNTGNFSEGPNYNVVRIDGSGFDNMLIAEFILNLKSTMNQEFDESDLRSLVYFDDVVIHSTKTNVKDLKLEQNLDNKIVISKYLVDINDFSISFKFKEKKKSAKEIDQRLSKILSKMKMKL